MPDDPLTIEIVTRSGAFFDRGPYDSDAAYEVGDVVLSDGALWRWRYATAGNVAPTDFAPQWRRIGGQGGSGGPAGGLVRLSDLSTPATVYRLKTTFGQIPIGPDAVVVTRLRTPLAITGFLAQPGSSYDQAPGSTYRLTVTLGGQTFGPVEWTTPTPVGVVPGIDVPGDLVFLGGDITWHLERIAGDAGGLVAANPGTAYYEAGVPLTHVSGPLVDLRVRTAALDLPKQVIGPSDPNDLPGYADAALGAVPRKSAGGLTWEALAAGEGDVTQAEFDALAARVTTLEGRPVLNAEYVQDTVAAMLGTSGTYDDAAGTYTITGASGLDPEAVRDLVAAFVKAGTNVTVTHNDAADTLTIAASGGGGGGTPSTATPFAYNLNTQGGIAWRGYYAPSNAVPTVTRVTPFAGNPIITRGPAGSPTYGDVRDHTTWKARDRDWMLVTQAASATAPYGVTVGLRSSVDGGETWVDHGTVLTPNLTPGQQDSGARFSIHAHHDDVSGVTYIPYSGVPTDEGWYGGESAVFLIRIAPDADYTNPASYVLVNGGAPILVRDQGWEGGQGCYAPSLLRGPTKWELWYNSNLGAAYGGGSEPKIGVAYADSPEGPWTKHPAPIFPVAGAPKTEEMSQALFPNGHRVAVLDEALGAGDPRLGLYVCTEPTGRVWTRTGTLPPLLDAWNAGQLGSTALTWRSTGELLLTVSGKPSGASVDSRTIGGYLLEFEGTLPHKFRALASGGPGGGGGSFTPYDSASRPSPTAGGVILDTDLGRPLSADGYRWIDFDYATADLEAAREYLLLEGEGAGLSSPIRDAPNLLVGGAAAWDKGLLANGTSTYVDFGTLFLPGPMTFVAIVRRSVGAKYDVIISGTGSFFKWGFGTDDKMRVDNSGNANLAKSTSTYPGSEAYRFVAVTYTPSGPIRFYNAAGPDGATTPGLGVNASSGNFALLRDPGAVNEYLTGTLTYFGYSNRVLSGAAIARLYTQLAAFYALKHGISVV